MNFISNGFDNLSSQNSISLVTSSFPEVSVIENLHSLKSKENQKINKEVNI